MDISWTYYAIKSASRNERINMIKTCGVKKFLFISEGDSFYLVWNMILLNEPPLLPQTTSSTKIISFIQGNTTFNNKNKF